MFSFSKKDKTKEIQKEVEHYSLRQAVERLASKGALAEPYADYNRDLVDLFRSEVERIRKSFPHQPEEKVWAEAIGSLKLPPEIVLMLAATGIIHSLWVLVRVIKLEAYFLTAQSGGDATEQAQKTLKLVLKQLGVNAAVMLLFPPRERHGSEDFDITHAERRIMQQSFFSLIKTPDQLTEIFDEFLSENPYFRLYPINK